MNKHQSPTLILFLIAAFTGAIVTTRAQPTDAQPIPDLWAKELKSPIYKPYGNFSWNDEESITEYRHAKKVAYVDYTRPFKRQHYRIYLKKKPESLKDLRGALPWLVNATDLPIIIKAIDEIEDTTSLESAWRIRIGFDRNIDSSQAGPFVEIVKEYQ